MNNNETNKQILELKNKLEKELNINIRLIYNKCLDNPEDLILLKIINKRNDIKKFINQYFSREEKFFGRKLKYSDRIRLLKLTMHSCLNYNILGFKLGSCEDESGLTKDSYNWHHKFPLCYSKNKKIDLNLSYNIIGYFFDKRFFDLEFLETIYLKGGMID